MNTKRSILLPIHPEFVQKILNESKKYEYRKHLCKAEISRIYIYETFPTKKIVGEVEVLSKITEEKGKLWKDTQEYSGISWQEFDIYFKNSQTASAYKLGKVERYERNKDLKEFNIKNYPQSYIYL